MVQFASLRKKFDQFCILYAIISLVFSLCGVNFTFWNTIGTLLGIVPIVENSYELFSYIKKLLF